MEQDIAPDLGAVEAPPVIGERSDVGKDVGARGQGCKRAFFFPFLLFFLTSASSFNNSILDVRAGDFQGSNRMRGGGVWGHGGNPRANALLLHAYFSGLAEMCSIAAADPLRSE